MPHRPSREPTPILRGWRPPVECHHSNAITLKSTHPPLVIPIDKQQRLSRQQASFPVEFNLVAVRPPIATPPGAVLCSARAGGQSVGYGYAASASVPLISIRPRLLKHLVRGMATCRRTSRSSAVLHTARAVEGRCATAATIQQPHLPGHRHHTEYSVYPLAKSHANRSSPVGPDRESSRPRTFSPSRKNWCESRLVSAIGF